MPVFQAYLNWHCWQDDPSVVIIKRWVPDYEQEFLWDHTYQLRNGGKGRGAAAERSSKYSAPPPSTYARADAAPHLGTRSRSYDSVGGAYEPTSSKEKNRSGSLSESNRQQSYESVTSAPDTEDIARRRRHSRTLSIERPQGRPHKQKSYDSVRSPRDRNRKEYNWSSDGETAGRRTSGIFSEIKKSFGRSTTSSNPAPLKDSVKKIRSEEETRRSQRRQSSRLVKVVVSDSEESGSELEMKTRRDLPLRGAHSRCIVVDGRTFKVSPGVWKGMRVEVGKICSIRYLGRGRESDEKVESRKGWDQSSGLNGCETRRSSRRSRRVHSAVLCADAYTL